MAIRRKKAKKVARKATRKATRRPVAKKARRAVRRPAARKARKVVRRAAKRRAVRKPVRRKAAKRRIVRKPARRKAAKRRVVRKPARRPAKRPAKKAVAKKKPAPKPTPAPKPAPTPAPRPAVPTPPAPRPAAPAAVAPTPAPKSTLTKEHCSGRFCWYDCVVPDTAAAVKFYTALFGWTTKTMDMGPAGPYTVFSAGGVDFAGAMKPAMPGVPSHWLAYVGVPDADAACITVRANGGTVHVPPTNIPTVGRFAVIADPTGGSIAPFQPAGPPMRDLTVAPGIGLVGWNELVTPDPAKAGAFYTRLFGWMMSPMPMSDGSMYQMFRRGGSDVAGMMKTPPNAPSGPGRWLIYIHVADADATAKKAEGLGARVLMAPWTVPAVGRLAVLADPSGAVFALHQPEKKAS